MTSLKVTLAKVEYRAVNEKVNSSKIAALRQISKSEFAAVVTIVLIRLFEVGDLRVTGSGFDFLALYTEMAAAAMNRVEAFIEGRRSSRKAKTVRVEAGRDCLACNRQILQSPPIGVVGAPGRTRPQSCLRT